MISHVFKFKCKSRGRESEDPEVREKQMNKILVWEEGGSGRPGEEHRLE